MSPLTFLAAHTFIAGALGILARVNIAAFLLSSESVDSPNLARCIVYRYLVFSFHFMVSFLLTPVFMKPFLDQFRAISAHDDIRSYLYLVACVPLAALLYYLDHKFLVWSDAAKIAGRERLREQMGTRYRRGGSGNTGA